MIEPLEPTGGRHVILCDDRGTPTGTADLLAAHRADGQLHLAFSVFVFRRTDRGPELLIQQRSQDKALFAGRWANTCCSHPAADGKGIAESGQIRMQQECGFSVPLQVAGSFVYRAQDSQAGGMEYEYDTVLVGQAPADVRVQANPAEVADWKWIPVDDLERDLERNDARYAPWLHPALRIALEAGLGPGD